MTRQEKSAIRLLALTALLGALVGALTTCLVFAALPKPTEEEKAPEAPAVTTAQEIEEPAEVEEPAGVEEITEPEEPAEVVEDLGVFKLTAYCACEKCCGEWADGITYTGTVATQGRTIAVDPKTIPLGSTVRIYGQDYIAEDIGGAIKGNRVDVFFNSHQEALEFGVQHANVSIIHN